MKCYSIQIFGFGSQQWPDSRANGGIATLQIALGAKGLRSRIEGSNGKFSSLSKSEPISADGARAAIERAIEQDFNEQRNGRSRGAEALRLRRVAKKLGISIVG